MLLERYTHFIGTRAGGESGVYAYHAGGIIDVAAWHEGYTQEAGLGVAWGGDSGYDARWRLAWAMLVMAGVAEGEADRPACTLAILLADAPDEWSILRKELRGYVACLAMLEMVGSWVGVPAGGLPGWMGQPSRS